MGYRVKLQEKKTTVTFGQFARQVRESQTPRLTQHQVAKYFGVKNRSSICHLESGKNKWLFWQVEKFAELLGVKTSKLIAEFEYFQQNPKHFRD